MKAVHNSRYYRLFWVFLSNIFKTDKLNHSIYSVSWSFKPWTSIRDCENSVTAGNTGYRMQQINPSKRQNN